MMLAWSTCEPPNGYGVTNCSSLSGNALAALVSAKAAAAVVASEVIDRRVVMIRLIPRNGRYRPVRCRTKSTKGQRCASQQNSCVNDSYGSNAEKLDLLGPRG